MSSIFANTPWRCSPPVDADCKRTAALATVTPLHRAYGRFISAISRVMSVHSSSRLVKLSSSSRCLRSSSHLSSSYANSRCGWIITFSRRARTKQYARGKDMPNARITSAMQMVALRDTPTRQCTRVAMPFCRPRSTRWLVSFDSIVPNNTYR